ncbi:MAG: aldo/keto reductase [Acidimicrobiaceae bacterium]|nr:aldo/keto reductase [Acidimicrobiaceae bacterium]
MELRRIGELEVSEVGLGCNNFGTRVDQDTTNEIFAACLDTGINFFDTADVYGSGASEEMLGHAIKGHRDQVVVATKFGLRDMDPGLTGGSAEWVRRSIDRSLRRLDTDWIDLFQIHTPDHQVHERETLEALNELVVAGKVREIGCSNYDAERLDSAADISQREALASYRTVQNRYSLLYREPESEVFDVCREQAMGFLPFFPLESGLLTGKVAADGPRPGTRLAEWPEDRLKLFMTDRNLAAVERLTHWVSNRDRSLLDLAFSWLLSKPEIPSVIAGATSGAQVLANSQACGWRISAVEMDEIDDLLSTSSN